MAPDQSISAETAQEPAARRSAGALSFLIIGALLATVVAVALVALSGAAGYAVAGLSDPGQLTRYGVTVA
ncbi:MAG: hypothetical protein ACRDSE_14320, partial [Pseudonocardiaceae bacterium]